MGINSSKIDEHMKASGKCGVTFREQGSCQDCSTEKKCERSSLNTISGGKVYNIMEKLHNKYRGTLGKYNPKTISTPVQEDGEDTPSYQKRKKAWKNAHTSLHSRAQYYCEFLACSNIWNQEDIEDIKKSLIPAGSVRWNTPTQQKGFADDFTTRNDLCLNYLGAHLPVNTNAPGVGDDPNIFITNNSSRALDQCADQLPFLTQQEYAKALTGGNAGASVMSYRGCGKAANSIKSSWPADGSGDEKLVLPKWNDAKWCPIAYMDGGGPACPGLQGQRNTGGSIHIQQPLSDSQNIGIFKFKHRKGGKITLKDIKRGLNHIFRMWIKGVCTGCVAAGKNGICSLCKDNVLLSANDGTSSAYAKGTAETWGNIVWGNNANIGVGTTIIHHKNNKYLLCVINYQYPPDTSDLIRWQKHMPTVCFSQSQRWRNKQVCPGKGKDQCQSCTVPKGNAPNQI